MTWRSASFTAAETTGPRVDASEVTTGGRPGVAAGPTVAWRFVPASWMTDHRAALDGVYGSTYHAAYLRPTATDYVYFTHDDGSGAYVGHDPGQSVGELDGLTGHEVQLPAGNSTAPEVAALAQPVIAGISGLTCADLEDGTVAIGGTDSATTGGAFADRAGGGSMGVRVASLLSSDPGPGALNNVYLSRLVVPGAGETRRIRTVRVWIEAFNATDLPRFGLWRGDATAPTTLALDLGQLVAARVSAPGWYDFHIPPDADIAYGSGDYLYLSGQSTVNLTSLRYLGSGSGLRGDWDGTFALFTSDGTMGADATVPLASAWTGGLGGSVAVIFAAQIIWSDDAAPVGDASLERYWGSPRSAPIGQFLNATALPRSIVHMVAPLPAIGGLQLGAGHIGLGANTSTGSMRVEFWTGDASNLDGTFPHNPASDGLVSVHDYGAETTLSPNAWYDFPAPSTPVSLDGVVAAAVSMHSDGLAGSAIRFELTGTGLASTMNNRELAFDWYPVLGTGAGNGSEVEAYDATSPDRVNDGNLTVNVDPALPATTPHQQDADDVYQGNCPALGVTLTVLGMGPA